MISDVWNNYIDILDPLSNYILIETYASNIDSSLEPIKTISLALQTTVFTYLICHIVNAHSKAQTEAFSLV